jgi:hypothetical protein
MGDTNTKLSGPDTASGPDSYTNAFSTEVMARMSHFSWHSYSGNSVSTATALGNIKADWMTETSKWCSGCDNNQPPGESEWSFGKGIGDILLGDIKNGFSSVLTWEGFDTFYYHHNSYSAWGHVGCTQNGEGCVVSDTYPRVYSIRKRAYPEATIAKAISPGMVMLGTTTSISTLSILSFYDAINGKFSIVGHNTGSSAVTINGQMQNLPAIRSLFLYQTNSSLNLQHMNDVPVNGRLFTATIPADTFFYLVNIATTPSSKFINGTVIDSINKTGISGVTVSTNSSVTTMTDATGFYSLTVSGIFNLTAKLDPTHYVNNTITVSTECCAVVIQDIELVEKPKGIITGSIAKFSEVIG